MYFNVNFNVFFKLIKVYLLVSELYFTMYVSFNHRSLRRGVHNLKKRVRTTRAFQTGIYRSAKQKAGTLRE